jgi:hypothetical protein
MFSNDGKDKVYNSQMVLYLFSQVLQLGKQPEQIIDANLQIDYERLRRLSENENNSGKLLQIAQDGGIYGNIIERFSFDKLPSEEYFISLLFYLGMLTKGGTQRGLTWLKIPNYSIKTLYWEFAIAAAQGQETKSASASELSKTISQMAYDGDILPYLDFFSENILKRLSNRDLINFDEKYIKTMMLATLFMSRLYLPVSENENISGYTDIYLQKHPAVQDIKFEHVFEVKYTKTGTDKNEKEAKFAEAAAQIEKYKKDPRFANRNDIKFAAILFEGKTDYEAR